MFYTLTSSLLQWSCIAFSFHGLSTMSLSHSHLFSIHPSHSLHSPAFFSCIQPHNAPSFVSLYRRCSNKRLSAEPSSPHLSPTPRLTFSPSPSVITRASLVISFLESSLARRPLLEIFQSKDVGVEQ